MDYRRKIIRFKKFLEQKLKGNFLGIIKKMKIKDLFFLNKMIEINSDNKNILWFSRINIKHIMHKIIIQFEKVKSVKYRLKIINFY
jgi:hypothetical protein